MKMFYATESEAQAAVRLLNSQLTKGQRVYSRRYWRKCWVVYLSNYEQK
jgi:hypothetical protein